MRLASPIADLKGHYDVVIVGSGYGGAIAASRLGRVTPKLSVCVLERGRELQPGNYPDTPAGVLAETQVDTPTGHFRSRTGLYDLRKLEALRRSADLLPKYGGQGSPHTPAPENAPPAAGCPPAAP